MDGRTNPEPQEGHMSDEDTAQETEVTQQEAEEQQNTMQEPGESPEDEQEQAWDPERAKRKISKVNSENKALRERATKAEEKAKGIDDITRERDDLSTANLRLTVGYELGLPMSLATRLQGSTKEEMVADAETLVDLVSAKQPSSRKPTEALRTGLAPEQEPEERDLKKLGARMFER